MVFCQRSSQRGFEWYPVKDHLTLIQDEESRKTLCGEYFSSRHRRLSEIGDGPAPQNGRLTTQQTRRATRQAAIPALKTRLCTYAGSHSIFKVQDPPSLPFHGTWHLLTNSAYRFFASRPDGLPALRFTSLGKNRRKAGKAGWEGA